MIATQTTTKAPKGRRLLVDRSDGLKAFGMPSDRDILYSDHDEREELVINPVEAHGRVMRTLYMERKGVLILAAYLMDHGADRDMGITFRARESESIELAKDPARYSLSVLMLKEAGVRGLKI